MSSYQPNLFTNTFFCGRDQEINHLFNEFENIVNHRSKIAVIYGEAGIGKSLLIQKFSELVTIRPQVIVSIGKFEQLKFNSPLNVIKLVLEAVILDINKSPVLFNEITQTWQNQDNLNYLMAFLPVLKKYLKINDNQSQSIDFMNEKRLFHALDQFFESFYTHKIEIVLVFEDIHWMDQSTLQLLEYLFLERLKPLRNIFCLMTSRLEELRTIESFQHFFKLCKDSIPNDFIEIFLTPLDQFNTENLLDSIFVKSRHPINEFAQICLKKTGGNPFFVMQFLTNLYNNQLITYDSQTHAWNWDIEQIINQEITENVVDLVIRNIDFISDECRQILIMASCLGNMFDIDILTDLVQMPLSLLINELIPALEHHLILEHDNKFYKFSHDKIQQSFYGFINLKEQQQYHLNIGNYLYHKIPKYERYERVFEIVDHLNLSLDLISDLKTKMLLIELNLVSSRRAKNKTAYESAFNYIQISHRLLQQLENHWEYNYQLSFHVFKEYASILYCNSRFEEAEILIKDALIHVKSLIERATLCDILMSLYTSIGRYTEAIQVGLEMFHLFGLSINLDNLDEQFLANFYEIHEFLKYKSTRSLLNLPKNETEEFKLLANIGKKLGITCYIANTRLYRVINLLLLKESLKQGYTSESSIDYASYGVFVGTLLGNYKKSYKYGELALKLADKFKGDLRYMTLFLHTTHLHHWGELLYKSLELYRQIYKEAIQFADMQFACYGMLHEIIIPFYSGHNLEEINNQFHDVFLFIKKYRNYWGLAIILGFKLVMDNLRNKTSNMLNFDCPDYEISEDQYFAQFKASDSGTVPVAYLVIKAQTYFIYNQYEKSFDLLMNNKHLLPIIEGLHLYIDYQFYIALNLMQRLLENKNDLNQTYLDEFNEILKKFNKWQKTQEDNFKNRYLLLKAEYAYFNEKYSDALKFYDEAIALSKQNGYLQIYAISCERAGLFWYQQSKMEFAQIYLEKAQQAYLEWGAIRKVNLLKQSFDFLDLD